MIDRNAIHVLSRAVIMDQGHILLCKTLDLPKSFYFLPGGHIEYGESAEAAVIREVLEESGAQCSLKRFLGCLEHSFEPGHSSICHNHEYNLIFEAESPSLKRNIPIPQQEDHIQLLWMSLSAINEIDFRPHPLKILVPQWLDTIESEKFRSAMHEI
jgi:8-oxo-dGTP pyrophosphatase MutT (NUDIX family)